MTTKVDFKKSLAAYRATRGQFKLVDVPDLQYLMVDGHGDPNTSPAFTDAVEALYPVAYRVKFASKRVLGRDYVVPPLEGLWWAEDMDAFTAARDKSRWYWTLMIMVPDWIDQAMVAAAVEQAAAGNHPARLDDVRLAPLSEGRCVQTLHVGRFDEEADVLAWMHHEFIPANGLEMVGTHHEIYLSDARRTAPVRLRTILRQPVATRAVPGSWVSTEYVSASDWAVRTVSTPWSCWLTRSWAVWERTSNGTATLVSLPVARRIQPRAHLRPSLAGVPDSSSGIHPSNGTSSRPSTRSK